MAKKPVPPGPPIPGAEEAGGGKGKLKLIIAIAVAFLLAIGLSIGGTLFFLGRRAPRPA